MDKFELAEMMREAKPAEKAPFIAGRCAGKTVLDLGCVRHNAEFASKDADWLHKKIKATAKKVVGVDYLPEEVAKINSLGYDVVLGDVTKPLGITERFDVIVAGDLLEHLANFEGFFSNCRTLLKPDGELIITTPNPFFNGQFHYSAFKKNFIVNPEHTCWIDPQCLSQLAGRYGFRIAEAAYIRRSWSLPWMICETPGHRYDIINGRWQNDTAGFKIKRLVSLKVFGLFYFLYCIFTGTNSALCSRSDYLAVLRRQ